jgi:Anti-sigma factor NepR
MAEQNTAKEGQVSEMNPRQTAETTPLAPAPGGPGIGATLEGDLQAHIGRQLRAVYEEVVNEAVPDRFLKLLEELERKKADRS